MHTIVYRKDIDGLRAIAVLSVIAFHFGIFPNGFLGVDVFFVISGYLITKILVKELEEDSFSIVRFYLRRTRRIIPLVLFVNLIALIVGVVVMLPDDLENLSQSVIATNFFSNNILQFITTRNYWDVVNEYKPLMHTWSLGIEEQFYLVYPFIFVALGHKRVRLILPVLIVLTILSVVLFIVVHDDAARFYLIPFRFFELAIGGLGAIVWRERTMSSKYALLPLVFLLLLLTVSIPHELQLCLVTLVSLAVLLSSNQNNRITTFLLCNPIMTSLGKISFSLYMWHQLILAFVRYFVVQEIEHGFTIFLFGIMVLLSWITYVLIEQPFRDLKRTSNVTLLYTLGAAFILTTGFSFYIYTQAGIIRDVPELGLKRGRVERNIHSRYNARIYDRDVEFTQRENIKILVIGNSFARDWANVLLESKFNDSIEVSYIFDYTKHKQTEHRLVQADYVFFSSISKVSFDSLVKKFGPKIWSVGTKNFGTNNGIFYNRRNDPNYCSQRTILEDGYLERNASLKKQFKERYIDLIGMVIDNDETVPVFTPDCKFISQDCRHLTESGAKYFALLFEKQAQLVITKRKL